MLPGCRCPGCGSTRVCRWSWRRPRRSAGSIPCGQRERVTISYQLHCRRRGYYPVGPLQLASGDLFGFVDVQGRDVGQQFLTVYPRIIPLVGLALPSRLPFGTLASNQRLFEDPARLRGLREYQSGDSQRRINWKASAHSELAAGQAVLAGYIAGERPLPQSQHRRVRTPKALRHERVGYRRGGFRCQLSNRRTPGCGPGHQRYRPIDSGRCFHRTGRAACARLHSVPPRPATPHEAAGGPGARRAG